MQFRQSNCWLDSPPTCVYLCLTSHRLLTNCSTGIGSWYKRRYLRKNKTDNVNSARKQQK